MTTIAKREQDAAAALASLSNEQLKFIANTDFIPKSMRGNLPAILACVATGRAMGLADMDALRSIHIIDGKASMSAELMVKLARRNGHSISGNYGDGEVTVNGKRHDTGDEMSVTWTIAMAQRAGLVGKDNWKKYPESMLWARAASQLCRMLFPDVLGGVSYTPDEAEFTDEDRIVESLGSLRAPVDNGPDDGGEQAGEIVSESDEQPVPPATAEQAAELLALVVELTGHDDATNWQQAAQEFSQAEFGRTTTDLSETEMAAVVAFLRSQVPVKGRK